MAVLYFSVMGMKTINSNYSLTFQRIYCLSEFDECSSNPCMNGGTCTDGNNNYTCACPSPYFGKQCQRMYNKILLMVQNIDEGCLVSLSVKNFLHLFFSWLGFLCSFRLNIFNSPCQLLTV